MEQLIIKNEEDRRIVCGILAANGYTVRIGKIKVGSQAKSTVEYEKAEEKKEK